MLFSFFQGTPSPTGFARSWEDYTPDTNQPMGGKKWGSGPDLEAGEVDRLTGCCCECCHVTCWRACCGWVWATRWRARATLQNFFEYCSVGTVNGSFVSRTQHNTVKLLALVGLMISWYSVKSLIPMIASCGNRLLLLGVARRRVQLPNDVIQKIKKTLNNTHTPTQKRSNKGSRNNKKHAFQFTVKPVLSGHPRGML